MVQECLFLNIVISILPYILPIKLVYAPLFVEMFENLELGLLSRKNYDVDERLFDTFKR
jgi:hypothetical protein